jgi:hypothetical protein
VNQLKGVLEKIDVLRMIQIISETADLKGEREGETIEGYRAKGDLDGQE